MADDRSSCSTEESNDLEGTPSGQVFGPHPDVIIGSTIHFESGIRVAPQGFIPNFDYVAYTHLMNNHRYMGVVPLTQPMSNVFPTQATVSAPHGVSTGAGSDSIFLEMSSQISAEMTPPNNTVEYFPVFKQQMEESHRDVVNMLTEQITAILNPIIENNSAKIEQVAR
ncbi:hypothetical protein PIB30_023713 [Stylosanthes scabra]|uniref:Uncharacterized protein n=1 Tax=Stylosanthes scabra TaxID=79078 RepID=A0ABU6V918_9FABA|nr:hypothetical protein [Stylosanthes scabra]